jgi:hypothetical protein
MTAPMYPVVLHMTRQERCSRLLVLLRPLFLLPHVAWALFYHVLVAVVLLLSGPAILFFGRHPEVLWDILEGYLRYMVKVNAFALLLSDTYPPFVGGSDSPYPVRVHSSYPARMSRLVMVLRPVLALPHLFVLSGYALYILLLLHLAVLISLVRGCLPRWLWKRMSGFLLYTTRVASFCLLLVDEYPPFNTRQPLAAERFFRDE